MTSQFGATWHLEASQFKPEQIPIVRSSEMYEMTAADLTSPSQDHMFVSFPSLDIECSVPTDLNVQYLFQTALSILQFKAPVSDIVDADAERDD